MPVSIPVAITLKTKSQVFNHTLDLGDRQTFIPRDLERLSLEEAQAEAEREVVRYFRNPGKRRGARLHHAVKNVCLQIVKEGRGGINRDMVLTLQSGRGGHLINLADATDIV